MLADLLHGGSVDCQGSSEPISTSQIRSPILGSSTNSVGEGLGLMRSFYPLSGNWDGEVGVLGISFTTDHD